MKKCFERINMVLIIITMVLVLTIFGNEAMKIQGSANAGNKTVANAQSVLSTNETKTTQIALGEYYSNDGKYTNPTIPVYTIQKTRSDTENMVIVFCGEGVYKKSATKVYKRRQKGLEGRYAVRAIS